MQTSPPETAINHTTTDRPKAPLTRNLYTHEQITFTPFATGSYQASISHAKISFRYFTSTHILKYNGIPCWPVSQQETIWYDNILKPSTYIVNLVFTIPFKLPPLLPSLNMHQQPRFPADESTEDKTPRTGILDHTHTLPSLFLYSFYKFFSSMWLLPIWTWSTLHTAHFDLLYTHNLKSTHFIGTHTYKFLFIFYMMQPLYAVEILSI